MKSIDHYRIVRELGRGAMGVVYVARDENVDRDVALKIMQPGLLNELGLERFRQEAQAVAKLRHPGIVTIHHLSVFQGRPYLVMDLIEGESLYKRLASTGPLDAKLAARVAGSLADALAHAHQRGILHRDVKPANVLVAASGHAVLTDFGLAKDLSASREQLTLSGHVVGTPGYLSPEQGRGAIHEVDARSDVYGLGATLYAMLTGRAPFEGNPAQLVRMVLEDPPQPPSALNADVPADLESICLKCLEKDREARYASVTELALDLKRFLDGEAVEASPRRLRFKGKTLALGAVVLASLGLVLGVALMPQKAPQQASPTATPADPTPDSPALTAEQQRAADKGFQRIRRVSKASKRMELAESWLERFAGHPLEERVRTQLAADLSSNPVRVLKLATPAKGPRDRGRDSGPAIAFSTPDTLATLTQEQLVFWDVASGEQLRSLQPQIGFWSRLERVNGGVVFGSHNGKLTWVLGTRKTTVHLQVDNLAVSPQGDRVAVATRNEQLQIFDVGASTPALSLKHSSQRARALCFSPSGQQIGILRGGSLAESGSNRSRLTVYALDGRLLHEVPAAGAPSCAAFVSETQVLIGTWAGLLSIWDLTRGQPAVTFVDPQATRGLHIGRVAHTTGIGSVAVLRDGTAWSLARSRRGSFDRGPTELALWDLETGKRLRSLQRDGGQRFAVSPDERTLAISLATGEVELWKLNPR